MALTITTTNTTLWLPGKGKGKARPRKCGNTYVLPKDYRITKERGVQQVILQCVEPITYQCFVECLFINFKTSDADNLIGFYLDVLVQAGVLQNDSSSYVSGCSGRFVQTSDKKTRSQYVGTLIKITPSEIVNIDVASLPLTYRESEYLSFDVSNLPRF